MGKQKYYYNTETCKFEKSKRLKKNSFLILSFLTLILITSIGLVASMTPTSSHQKLSN